MLANWVKETSTTTGTGTLTLTSVPGFPRFSEAFAVNELVNYAILTDDSPPKPLEWGIGTIGASNTLARSVVLGTYAGSVLETGSPTAVSLSAGTYNIICTQVMGSTVPGIIGVDSTNGSGGILVPFPWMTSGSAGGLGTTADRLYLCNFRVSTPRKITSIKMRVGISITGNCRMGIYKVKTDGTAGELLYSSEDISTTAGGVISWTFSPAKILPPGWYYFGFAPKGIAPNMNVFSYNATYSAETLVGTDSTAVQGIIYKYAALSGGWTTLPNPAPTSLTAVNNSAPPAFGLTLG
jgi:hypothetical protein